MRVTNPPASQGAAVSVSKISAPTVLATLTPVSFASLTPVTFAGDSTVYERIFFNCDLAAIVYINDTVNTAAAAGIAILPQGSAVVTTSAAVQLTTQSASPVTVNPSLTKNV